MLLDCGKDYGGTGGKLCRCRDKMQMLHIKDPTGEKLQSQTFLKREF